MRRFSVRTLVLLAGLPLCLATMAVAAESPADAAEDASWSEPALQPYDDFADLALQLDDAAFRDRDAVSVWTGLASRGRPVGGDALRLDWTPVTDQLISRRNRMAGFKPSSGLGVDFDAPSESVVVEWRIGF